MTYNNLIHHTLQTINKPTEQTQPTQPNPTKPDIPMNGDISHTTSTTTTTTTNDAWGDSDGDNDNVALSPCAGGGGAGGGAGASVQANTSTTATTTSTSSTAATAAGSEESKPGDDAIKTNWSKEVESFDELPIQENLLRGIYNVGYEAPTNIQRQAILPVLAGRDTIAQAQSGTGKTATFCIPSLQAVDTSVKGTQVVILAPTRDLAQQIHLVLTDLSTYLSGVTAHCCIGGASVRDDIRLLSTPGAAHIVVGTPGRVHHMASEGYLDTKSVRLVVLDEADDMLDARGHRDSVYDICSLLPRDVQVGLFSATLTNDTMEVTKKFMRNPAVILVKPDMLTLAGIKQFYVNVGRGSVPLQHKLQTLLDVYELLTISQAIIFVNTKRVADWLVRELTDRDFPVTAFHADLAPADRNLVMREFRAGRARVLVATDVIARGIDVQGVSLVINWEMPVDRERYLHRIGRSGRFGRQGVAITLASGYDQRALADVEDYYGTQVEELPMDVNKYLTCAPSGAAASATATNAKKSVSFATDSKQ